MKKIKKHVLKYIISSQKDWRANFESQKVTSQHFGHNSSYIYPKIKYYLSKCAQMNSLLKEKPFGKIRFGLGNIELISQGRRANYSHLPYS